MGFLEGLITCQPSSYPVKRLNIYVYNIFTFEKGRFLYGLNHNGVIAALNWYKTLWNGEWLIFADEV